MVIVSNKESYAAFDLEGLSIPPGQMLEMKITPSLYDVTSTAENRFQDKGDVKIE